MLLYLLEDRQLIVNPKPIPFVTNRQLHKLIHEKQTEAKEISSTAHQSV